MSTTIGIRLTRDANGNVDMLLKNGKFAMAADGVKVASSLQFRLLQFRTECQESPIVDMVKEPLAGVDYYGVIFRTDVSAAEKTIEFKRAILSTPGVKRILRFSWSQSGRVVTISTDLQTDWGNESVSMEIIPL